MSSRDRSQARKHKGRRKVNMVKMENKSNLQVTFSKRRLGVFKKASELCTLSGAEVIVVVFSPGNKAYSFGQPNVDNIADRFLNSNSSLVNIANQSVHIQQRQNSNSQSDLEYLARIESQIEVEKVRGEEINQTKNAYEKEAWIPAMTSIEELNYKQLDHLKKAIIDFGQKLQTRMGKVVNHMMPYNETPSTYYVKEGGLPFCAGSSSKFDIPSCATMIPSYRMEHNTVIPYDHEATGPSEVDKSY
ncbi:MADS box transcription factor [Handroanthus impetiginosus]|uniref:MADS box transcription factor n=1 Tax=Handroanthus impetiginosus TaxID=429701 RepID=A0A2G9GRJ8_9LAMI|nr:MADS box transcription factor [Handroanthus impetiginosus]